jgi:hypothetical protein
MMMMMMIKGDEGVNSDDAGINDELFLYTDHDKADNLHSSISSIMIKPIICIAQS